MNMPVRVDAPNALAMREDEVVKVLQTSLYPGAAIESIKMVLGYCKASGLDPMQKPVHIVPMSVKTGRKQPNGYDETEMRDVVMPGIGLYRTQAARSGQYAGMSEPEFGPVVDDKVLGKYPEWCRVTVRRLLGDRVVEFTALEYWIENYATKSRNESAPNAMWKRRPFGQIAKCAEAQALRKAFPEIVGAEATADEMEGKDVERDVTPAAAREPAAPQEKPVYPAEKFAENLPKWRTMVENKKATPEGVIAKLLTTNSITEEQRKKINALAPIEAAAEQEPHTDAPALAMPVVM